MSRGWEKIRVLLLSAVLAGSLAGQLGAQQSLPDSSVQIVDDEAYYQIGKTRMIRWLRAHKDSSRTELFRQVFELVREAREFAGSGDFTTALLLLDTASSIVESSGDETQTQPVKEEAAPPEHDAGVSRTAAQDEDTAWTFEPQFITGIDLWQQRFELAYATDNNVYFESSDNPFAGARMRARRTSPVSGDFDLYAQWKNSRDYSSAEFELRHSKGRSTGNYWLFENRFENTRYKNSFNLRYRENMTTVQARFAPAPGFQIRLDDYFQLRNYGQETALYPNFWNNQAAAGFEFTSGLATRLTARYAFVTRKHQRYAENDYNAHRIEASIYQLTGQNSSIYLENIWRRRNYAIGSSDSSYQNSFQEEYLRGDFRFGLTSRLSLDTQAELTIRQHDRPNVITPDFVHIATNPRFLITVYDDWQIGLGYLFVWRVFKKDLVQTNLSATDPTTDDVYLGYEDYFSHGVSVSLELFRLGAFMLNLTDNYQVRTYPNTNADAFAGQLFNTNRRINSIMLLFSWQITSNLEFNVLANHDNEISIDVANGDSRNSLFSMDLGYTF